MTQPKVNGVKLNKALGQFGSLGKSIEAMQKKERKLTQHNAKLQLIEDNLSKQVQSLDSHFHKRQGQLQWLSDEIEHQRSQYDLFEGFLAMVAGSPSVTNSLEALIATFQKLADEDWSASHNTTELRSLFVSKVMGDYLKCYHCGSCGTKFMVNKEPQYKSISNYYQCPSCHTSHEVEPDDSFLKAMVSEKQMENIILVEDTLKENETLRPLKAFLNVPCEICGEPITEWTEDSVKGAVEGWGWGHSKCWNTDVGNLRLFSVLKKKVQSKISKR